MVSIPNLPNLASKSTLGNGSNNLLSVAGINLDSIDDEKAEHDGKSLAQLAEFEADDFVPYFRRNARYHGTPIKLSPVVNGISYVVRVKAVTLSGSKMSAFSSSITPKGPPPIPKINKLVPLESSVQIDFVCNDYATEEYKAKFDIESFPQTMTQKGIKESPYIFPKLNNGRAYKFHVRGVNKEGKSKWSEVSAPVQSHRQRRNAISIHSWHRRPRNNPQITRRYTKQSLLTKYLNHLKNKENYK